jgi:hypothetical protein
MEYREAKEVLPLSFSFLLLHPFFSLSFFRHEQHNGKVMTGYVRGRKGAQGESFVLRAPWCHSRGGEAMGLCRIQ